jgi:Holliday junction resolvase
VIKKLTDYAFPMLRDFYSVDGDDVDNLDPADLIDKIKRVHKGLSAEHEFAAIAAWLGKCSLLTALDDVLHSSGKYRVPDFLVIANHEGSDKSFLVEVKSTDNEVLDWSAKYLDSLRTFADVMKLPLLVAWKRGKLWTLTDISHFSLNVSAYRLSFETAMKNSLMGVLFGNAWIKFSPEFRLEVKMMVQGDVDVTAELLPEGTYEFRIEDAGIWGNKGRLNISDAQNLWWFLVTAASEYKSDVVHGVAIQQYMAESDSMFNLSDVLLAQVLWTVDEEASIDWLATIRKGLPAAPADLHSVLKNAIDAGAVNYVFHQVPQALPEFLK